MKLNSFSTTRNKLFKLVLMRKLEWISSKSHSKNSLNLLLRWVISEHIHTLRNWFQQSPPRTLSSLSDAFGKNILDVSTIMSQSSCLVFWTPLQVSVSKIPPKDSFYIIKSLALVIKASKSFRLVYSRSIISLQILIKYLPSLNVSNTDWHWFAII